MRSPARAVPGAAGRRRGLPDGGCSRTTCALIPPRLKELTPARHGIPSGRHSRGCVTTRNGPGPEVALRVGGGEVQARREQALSEGQDRLDQSGGTGSCVGVPDAGLHGAGSAGGAALAAAPERLGERGDVDGVAQRSAGAVRFHVGTGGRVDAGGAMGGFDHGGLEGCQYSI